MAQDIYLLLLSTLVSILVTYAFKYINPSASIVYWSPHFFQFNLPASPPTSNAPVPLITHTIVVQNIGARIAEQIEIVHQQPPQIFQLFPSLDHTVANTPGGEHIIRIGHLAPNEFVSIECLNFQFPILLYVRSKSGIARSIQMVPQRVFSRPFNLLAQGLIFIGILTLSYWLIKALIFFWTHV